MRQTGVYRNVDIGGTPYLVRRRAGIRVLAVVLFFPCTALGETVGLFSPVDIIPDKNMTEIEGTMRSRLVNVDVGRLGRMRDVVAALPRAGEPQSDRSEVHVDAVPASVAVLHMNLFDDVSVTAIAEWTEPTFSGGYSLSGSLLGDPLGSMTLVVNGNRVVGSVEAGGRMYRIRSAEAGLSSISQVEEPPFRCGVDDLSPETDHGH